MTSQIQAEPHPGVRILRFDLTQRCAHWANALLFGILMATALPLLLRIAGRHHRQAAPHRRDPPVGRNRASGADRDLAHRALGRPDAAGCPALQSLDQGRDPLAEDAGRQLDGVEKFNPGQKLNAIFVGGTIVVMLATGSVMQWFGHFPVSWRTGATFVHDVFAFVVFVVVVRPHLSIALTHPGSMRSMIKGWVTEAWAARHAPGWLDGGQPRAEPGGQRATPVARPDRALTGVGAVDVDLGGLDRGPHRHPFGEAELCQCRRGYFGRHPDRAVAGGHGPDRP